MRQRTFSRGHDLADLLPVHGGLALDSCPAAEVPDHGPPGEHVDPAQPGDRPRHGRPVDHHGRVHGDLLAHLAAQQVGGLRGFPAGVGQPSLLTERAVIEHRPGRRVAGHRPHGQPAIPALGVDREHPAWTHNQVVDDRLGAGDRPAVQGLIAQRPNQQQPVPGPALREGDPGCRRDQRHGLGLVDRVEYRGHRGNGQPVAPPQPHAEANRDDDHSDGTTGPDGHPRVGSKLGHDEAGRKPDALDLPGRLRRFGEIVGVVVRLVAVRLAGNRDRRAGRVPAGAAVVGTRCLAGARRVPVVIERPGWPRPPDRCRLRPGFPVHVQRVSER